MKRQRQTNTQLYAVYERQTLYIRAQKNLKGWEKYTEKKTLGMQMPDKVLI